MDLQFHMLTLPGALVFQGMGQVYEEFNYSIANLLLATVALSASRWIDGGWPHFGAGKALEIRLRPGEIILAPRSGPSRAICAVERISQLITAAALVGVGTP